MDAMEYLLFVLEMRVSSDEDREEIRKAVVEIADAWNAQGRRSMNDAGSDLSKLGERWRRRYSSLPLRPRR